MPLPIPTLCSWIFSIKAEQAGGCARASPWVAEDGAKENSIRLSRGKKRTYSEGEVSLVLFLCVLCCSSSHGASGITGFVCWHGLISRLCSECQAAHVPGSSGLLHSEILTEQIPAFSCFSFKGFSILHWPGIACKL